jgi:uncharacterized protein YndB with AHSA1/START domain
VDKNLIAASSITIDAPAAKVWDALVKPDAIKQYMFGTTLVSDWNEGSPISWSGEWQGKPYQDKGVVKRFTPPRLLQYTHFSPLMGLPDLPENYHNVKVELSEEGNQTQVDLSQDNNRSDEAREHSEKNWTMMLAGLKKYVEEQARMRR